MGVSTGVRASDQRELIGARWRAIQTAMRDNGLDVLAICGTSAIGQFGYLAFATGFVPVTRMACAVFGLDGPPVLYVPSRADHAAAVAACSPGDVRVTGEADALPVSSVITDVARQIIEGGGRRVGVAGMRSILTAGDFEALRTQLPSVEIQDATALVARLKSQKTAAEMRHVRDAMRLVESGLDAAEKLLDGGARAQRVIAGVEKVLREQGAWRTMVFVDSDSHYARVTTPTVIARHRLITVLVEAASATGYWAEIGDVFCIGTPRDIDRRIAAACHEALDAIHRAVRPGASVSEPLRIMQEIGRSHGLSLGRGLGHGVGLDHDLPALTSPGDDVFAQGQVLSIHPHYYREQAGIGGAAADTVIVGPAGVETVARRARGLRVIDV